VPGARGQVPPTRHTLATFVSYTQADSGWAEWIAWQLEAAGSRVLLQAWDMVPGSHWSATLHDGVQNSTRTIAVLSAAYLESVFGEAEWEAAWRADPRGLTRKLIPIRVEDCSRPGLLGRVVPFDLFGIPEDEARNLLLARIDAARIGRAKPVAEPEFPGANPPSDTRASSPPAFPPADTRAYAIREASPNHGCRPDSAPDLSRDSPGGTGWDRSDLGRRDEVEAHLESRSKPVHERTLSRRVKISGSVLAALLVGLR